MSVIERHVKTRGNRPPTKYEYQKDANVLNSEFIILNMFRNKRLGKTEGVKVNCSPQLLNTHHTKRKSREGRGEGGGGGRRREGGGGGEDGRERWRGRGMKKEAEEGERGKILGPVSSIFFFIFFFKQWHPVFLDVSLPWQL